MAEGWSRGGAGVIHTVEFHLCKCLSTWERLELAISLVRFSFDFNLIIYLYSFLKFKIKNLIFQ